MRKTMNLALALALLLSVPAGAAGPASGGVERLSYIWHIKGGFAWVAKLAFPSSGRGILETRDSGTVTSKLTINAPDAKGYYLYESQMAPLGARTLMSRNAYAYKDSHRDERVSFDFANNVTRIQRSDDDGTEAKVRRLQSQTPQDVLTSIYYLRQHADEIRQPRRAQVFSGNKGYDVIYRPGEAKMMKVGGKDVRVRPFSIQPIDKDAKFNGDVNVWLTDDARKLPVRIDIEEKYATLKLNLESLN